MKNIKDKTVIVTGGAAGLGFEIVNKVLENGAKIAIILDKNEEVGAEAEKKVDNKYGSGKAVFIKCDVTLDLDRTFELIISKYKSVDVLVNNAGIINEKSIRDTININLIAVMEWTIKFYDYMRSDRGGLGGTIVNIASLYGLRIRQFIPYYHASKFGVVGFSRSLGHEYNYKKTNVRVVALCPGFTRTNLTNSFCARDDDATEDFMKDANTWSWQGPDAVGRAVMEIVEKADSGSVWTVEGGQTSVHTNYEKA